MKKLFMLFVIFVAGCGYTSVNNELIGQVKTVKHNTPIFCYDFTAVDISLGVMRNGVGSMSTEDRMLTVPDNFTAILLNANKTGKLVKIKYDDRRICWCAPEEIVTGVEIVE